jgi:type IV secretory pathway VirB10-like protein
MVVVRLDAPGGDVMGQPDLAGNVNTHFGSRLAATAAYAGLDLVTTAGGVLAGAAAADAISGAGGTGVGIYNMRGLGRGLASREFEAQMNQRPSFERPQGQPCTVFITKPIDFRPALRKMKGRA